MLILMYDHCVYCVNQGSLKISLADALEEGSNRSNLPIICPNLTMSCLLGFSLRSPSKYISSNHSCKDEPEVLPVNPPPKMSVEFCHLTGNPSLAISCIWANKDFRCYQKPVKWRLAHKEFKKLSRWLGIFPMNLRFRLFHLPYSPYSINRHDNPDGLRILFQVPGLVAECEGSAGQRFVKMIPQNRQS